MKVLSAETNNMTGWDSYVNDHPNASVFHTSAWRKVVEAAYGHEAVYLTAKQGSEICGVLPLFLIKSRLFGNALSTCPYASSGAVCSNGVEETNSLVKAAIQIARQRKVKYLELKSTKLTECMQLQRHTDYLNYHILLDEPQILWRMRLKKATREAIRHGERAGLTTELGHQLLDQFYDVIAPNMRRLGTPVHSVKFYRNILLAFGSQANILAVKFQNHTIAAVLLVRYRENVVALYAGSAFEYLRMRPNDMLYWRAINYAHISGAKIFDFGRSLTNSGSAKFKEAWGAEARPLYYEYFLNGKRSMPKIQQNNRRYLLARMIWKRLPLRITKLVGPYLIKNVP